MRKFTGNWYLILILLIFITSVSSISQGNVDLTLTEGSRFDYAVLCTDYCGSKVWDATNLDADLYFYIESIDESNDLLSVYTRYNSTPALEKPDSLDYGIFTLNESYRFSSRESITEDGKYLWQWSRLEPSFRISIPSFFIAHAHAEFKNNSFLLNRVSELEEIELSEKETFCHINMKENGFTSIILVMYHIPMSQR